jgi:hypothetical protein
MVQSIALLTHKSLASQNQHQQVTSLVPLVQTGGEDISIFIINHGHEDVDGEGGQHDPHRDHHVVEPQLGEPALQPAVKNSQLAPAPP